jgi:hypothetical protein
MLNDLAMAVRLMRDLKPFLQQPLTLEDGLRLLRDRLARRDASFLDIMIATALDVLGNGAGSLMARHWRDARTLHVVRREPHATTAAKILPLPVINPVRSFLPPERT